MNPLGMKILLFSIMYVVLVSASTSGPHDDYAREIRERIAKHGLADFEAWGRQFIDGWSKQVLRIAITGQSGVGKSTFINTMRRLEPGQEGAADTSSNKRCTTQSEDYPDLRNPNVIYTDLPGVGTPDFPKEEYVKKVKLDSYDFVIILSANRFTENDDYLAEQLQLHGKNFFFVRTQIDRDIQTEREDHASQGKPFNENLYLAQTKKFCSKAVSRFSGTHPVFVISGRSKHYSSWDFPIFVQSLLASAEGLKREALIHTILPNSRAMVDQKVAHFEKRILIVASMSAAAAVIPQPGLSVACDITLLGWEVYGYFKWFGADVEVLKLLSKAFHLDPKVLMSVIYGSQVVWSNLRDAGMEKLVIKKLNEYALLNTIEEFARFVPVVGPVVAAGASFGVVHQTLHFFLNEIKTLAYARLDAIVAGGP